MHMARALNDLSPCGLLLSKIEQFQTCCRSKAGADRMLLMVSKQTVTRRHLQRRINISDVGKRQEPEAVSESQLHLKVYVSDDKSGEGLGQTAMRSGEFFIFLNIKSLDTFLVAVFPLGK